MATVKITVHEARGLREFPTTEPACHSYVIVELGDGSNHDISSVQPETNSPVFNSQFRFDLADPHLLLENPLLVVRLMDKSGLFFGRDVMIGCIFLDLSGLLWQDVKTPSLEKYHNNNNNANQLVLNNNNNNMNLLSPLLGPEASWFPLVDTQRGFRGAEVRLSVSVKFSTGFNPLVPLVQPVTSHVEPVDPDEYDQFEEMREHVVFAAAMLQHHHQSSYFQVGTKKLTKKERKQILQMKGDVAVADINKKRNNGSVHDDSTSSNSNRSSRTSSSGTNSISNDDKSNQKRRGKNNNHIHSKSRNSRNKNNRKATHQQTRSRTSPSLMMHRHRHHHHQNKLAPQRVVTTPNLSPALDPSSKINNDQSQQVSALPPAVLTLLVPPVTEPPQKTNQEQMNSSTDNSPILGDPVLTLPRELILTTTTTTTKSAKAHPTSPLLNNNNFNNNNNNNNEIQEAETGNEISEENKERVSRNYDDDRDEYRHKRHHSNNKNDRQHHRHHRHDKNRSRSAKKRSKTLPPPPAFFGNTTRTMICPSVSPFYFFFQNRGAILNQHSLFQQKEKEIKDTTTENQSTSRGDRESSDNRRNRKRSQRRNKQILDEINNKLNQESNENNINKTEENDDCVLQEQHNIETKAIDIHDEKEEQNNKNPSTTALTTVVSKKMQYINFIRNPFDFSLSKAEKDAEGRENADGLCLLPVAKKTKQEDGHHHHSHHHHTANFTSAEDPVFWQYCAPRGPIRESSGVFFFFVSELDPQLYRIVHVYGFVEELLVDVDPEQVRAARYQHATKTNEARLRTLFRLNASAKAQLSRKVLEFGCNCVLGFSNQVDFDSAGIVVRLSGTACLIAEAPESHTAMIQTLKPMLSEATSTEGETTSSSSSSDSSDSDESSESDSFSNISSRSFSTSSSSSSCTRSSRSTASSRRKYSSSSPSSTSSHDSRKTSSSHSAKSHEGDDKVEERKHLRRHQKEKRHIRERNKNEKSAAAAEKRDRTTSRRRHRHHHHRRRHHRRGRKHSSDDGKRSSRSRSSSSTDSRGSDEETHRHHRHRTHYHKKHHHHHRQEELDDNNDMIEVTTPSGARKQQQQTSVSHHDPVSLLSMEQIIISNNNQNNTDHSEFTTIPLSPASLKELAKFNKQQNRQQVVQENNSNQQQRQISSDVHDFLNQATTRTFEGSSDNNTRQNTMDKLQRGSSSKLQAGEDLNEDMRSVSVITDGGFNSKDRYLTSDGDHLLQDTGKNHRSHHHRDDQHQQQQEEQIKNNQESTDEGIPQQNNNNNAAANDQDGSNTLHSSRKAHNATSTKGSHESSAEVSSTRSGGRRKRHNRANTSRSRSSSNGSSSSSASGRKKHNKRKRRGDSNDSKSSKRSKKSKKSSRSSSSSSSSSSDSSSSTSEEDLMDVTQWTESRVKILTVDVLPQGRIMAVGGVVAARSVKLWGENHVHRTQTAFLKDRDAWWSELRDEIKTNAATLRCNAIFGYKESVIFAKNIAVLSCVGTAAVVDADLGSNALCTLEPEYALREKLVRPGLARCRMFHCSFYDDEEDIALCNLCQQKNVPEYLILSTPLPRDTPIDLPNSIKDKLPKEKKWKTLFDRGQNDVDEETHREEEKTKEADEEALTNQKLKSAQNGNDDDDDNNDEEEESSSDSSSSDDDGEKTWLNDILLQARKKHLKKTTQNQEGSGKNNNEKENANEHEQNEDPVASTYPIRRVEVRAVKHIPANLSEEDRAQAVAQAILYLEYCIHRQMSFRIRSAGHNVASEFVCELSVTETMVIATASAMSARVLCLPIPANPHLVVTDPALGDSVLGDETAAHRLQRDDAFFASGHSLHHQKNLAASRSNNNAASKKLGSNIHFHVDPPLLQQQSAVVVTTNPDNIFSRSLIYAAKKLRDDSKKPIGILPPYLWKETLVNKAFLKHVLPEVPADYFSRLHYTKVNKMQLARLERHAEIVKQAAIRKRLQQIHNHRNSRITKKHENNNNKNTISPTMNGRPPSSTTNANVQQKMTTDSASAAALEIASPLHQKTFGSSNMAQVSFDLGAELGVSPGGAKMSQFPSFERSLTANSTINVIAAAINGPMNSADNNNNKHRGHHHNHHDHRKNHSSSSRKHSSRRDFALRHENTSSSSATKQHSPDQDQVCTSPMLPRNSTVASLTSSRHQAFDAGNSAIMSQHSSSSYSCCSTCCSALSSCSCTSSSSSCTSSSSSSSPSRSGKRRNRNRKNRHSRKRRNNNDGNSRKRRSSRKKSGGGIVVSPTTPPAVQRDSSSRTQNRSRSNSASATPLHQHARNQAHHVSDEYLNQSFTSSSHQHQQGANPGILESPPMMDGKHHHHHHHRLNKKYNKGRQNHHHHDRQKSSSSSSSNSSSWSHSNSSSSSSRTSSDSHSSSYAASSQEDTKSDKSSSTSSDSSSSGDDEDDLRSRLSDGEPNMASARGRAAALAPQRKEYALQLDDIDDVVELAGLIDNFDDVQHEQQRQINKVNEHFSLLQQQQQQQQQHHNHTYHHSRHHSGQVHQEANFASSNSLAASPASPIPSSLNTKRKPQLAQFQPSLFPTSSSPNNMLNNNNHEATSLLLSSQIDAILCKCGSTGLPLPVAPNGLELVENVVMFRSYDLSATSSGNSFHQFSLQGNLIQAQNYGNNNNSDQSLLLHHHLHHYGSATASPHLGASFASKEIYNANNISFSKSPNSPLPSRVMSPSSSVSQKFSGNANMQQNIIQSSPATTLQHHLGITKALSTLNDRILRRLGECHTNAKRAVFLRVMRIAAKIGRPCIMLGFNMSVKLLPPENPTEAIIMLSGMCCAISASSARANLEMKELARVAELLYNQHHQHYDDDGTLTMHNVMVPPTNAHQQRHSAHHTHHIHSKYENQNVSNTVNDENGNGNNKELTSGSFFSPLFSQDERNSLMNQQSIKKINPNKQTRHQAKHHHHSCRHHKNSRNSGNQNSRKTDVKCPPISPTNTQKNAFCEPPNNNNNNNSTRSTLPPLSVLNPLSHSNSVLILASSSNSASPIVVRTNNNLQSTTCEEVNNQTLHKHRGRRQFHHHHHHQRLISPTDITKLPSQLNSPPSNNILSSNPNDKNNHNNNNSTMSLALSPNSLDIQQQQLQSELLFSAAKISSTEISLSLRKMALRRHKLLQALHKCFAPLTLSLRMADSLVAVVGPNNNNNSISAFTGGSSPRFVVSPQSITRNNINNSNNNNFSNNNSISSNNPLAATPPVVVGSHRSVIVTPMSFIPQRVVTKHVANLFYPYLREVAIKNSEYDVSDVDLLVDKYNPKKSHNHNNLNELNNNGADQEEEDQGEKIYKGDHFFYSKQRQQQQQNNNNNNNGSKQKMVMKNGKLVPLVENNSEHEKSENLRVGHIKFDFPQFLSESISNAQESFTAIATSLGANSILCFKITIHELEINADGSSAYVLFSLSGDAVKTQNVC